MKEYKDLETITETDDYIECDECGVPHDDGQEFTFIKPYDFESGHWVCLSCKEEIIRFMQGEIIGFMQGRDN